MTIQKSLLKYFLLIVLLRLSSTALAQFSLTTNSDGTIGISSYNGADGVVIIPNTINGKEVTAIGTGAFASDGSLTNIAIPDSVNTIGINSFLSALIWQASRLAAVLSISEPMRSLLRQPVPIHHEPGRAKRVGRYYEQQPCQYHV